MQELQLDVNPPAGGDCSTWQAQCREAGESLMCGSRQRLFRRLASSEFMPAVKKVGITTQPRIEIYPAHNVYVPAMSTISSLGASSLPR